MIEAEVVERLRAAGCVFAEDEARLLLTAAGSSSELAAMLDRREAGQPLEHILGWVGFCGQRILVEPGVFVPRQRSAFLVQQAALLASAGAKVLDLCCGSGALGVALKSMVDVDLYAADIDPAAVRNARRNFAAGNIAAKNLAAESISAERVFEGDLFAALPPGLRFDLILCNAPYVPTSALGLMPPEARDFEAVIALDGGADGLDVQRRVAASAPEWLVPGGHLLVESSAEQAPESAAIFEGVGLRARIVSSENGTVVVGTG